MNNSNDVAALLKRANEPLSILLKAQLGPVLTRETAEQEQRELCELTGGNFTVSEIPAKVGLSTGTIRGTVGKKWAAGQNWKTVQEGI